jgi:SAM-dependent methyltransferase
VGDARTLEADDGSVEVVLLMGPLYHLTDRDDRLAALREALRALVPHGVLFGVGISRFASLLDGLKYGRLDDPAFRQIVERDLRDGQHRNPDPVSRPEWFTTAFFHQPDKLAEEVAEAGFEAVEVLAIEGPGWLVLGAWDDPARREHVLQAARAAEAEPSLRGVGGHLLAVARTPA